MAGLFLDELILTRACKGGQDGANGEWYKGGQFLPQTIHCDKGKNQIKRAKQKITALYNLVRKAQHGFIVRQYSGYVAFVAETSKIAEIWDDINNKLINGEILGFEYFRNGKWYNGRGECE